MPQSHWVSVTLCPISFVILIGLQCSVFSEDKELSMTRDENAALFKQHSVYYERDNTGTFVVVGAASFKWSSNNTDVAKAIGSLHDLRELDCGPSNLSDRELQFFSTLSRLRHLNLSGTQVTGEGFKYLSGMTDLRELHCAPKEQADLAMKHIAALRTLERLGLCHSLVTDAGIAHIGRLTRMRELDLGQCPRLTGKAMAHLTKLKGLKDLGIGHTAIDDEGCQYLAELPNLEKLFAAPSRVTDAGVVRLKTLKNLEVLCVGPGITDAGLVHLAGMTKLKTLYLPECQITDEGLRKLQGLKNIENLVLLGTRITDASVDTLAGFPKLKDVLAMDTQMTKKGVTELKKRLPECDCTIGPSLRTRKNKGGG